MKINLPILFDEFSFVEAFRFPEDVTERNFSTFAIYRSGTRLEPWILYLVNEPEKINQQEAEGCSFIYIRPADEYSEYICHGYYLEVEASEEGTCQKLYQKLKAIFDKYNQWEQRLVECIARQEPVEAFCRLSLKILHNPVLVHDPEYQVIAAVDSDETPFNYIVREDGLNYLNQDAIRDLMFRPEFVDTLTERKPVLWLDVDDVTYSLCLNLFDSSNKYIGRLVVDQYLKFRKGLSALMVYLSEYIITTMEHSKEGTADRRELFKNVCVRYLSNPLDIYKMELRHSLNYYGWNRSDDYFCIDVQLSPKNVRAHMTKYEGILLDHSIGNCLSFHIGNELLLIYNLVQGGHSREEECENITYQIRDKGLSAGISTVFHNFLEFPNYYRQAKAALETGRQFEPMRWLFRFEDFRLKHVLQYGTDSLPFSVLLPDGLKKIREYDKQYDTELFRTFRNYILYDKRTVNAIDSLYVHRNTFQFRVKKIQEMVGMDLEKTDNLLYLRIIFYLLEHEIQT